MPLRRGLTRGRTIVSNRRSTGWEEGPGGTTNTQLVAVGSAFTGTVLQAVVDGLTLVRLRGQLQLFLSAASTATSGFAGAFGIGVATNAALAVGINAVPTPITEQQWNGWLFWTPIQFHSVTATIGDGVNAASVSQFITVDSKAMRKVPVEQSIYAALELSTEIGAATLNAFFDSRVLFKLP